MVVLGESNITNATLVANSPIIRDIDNLKSFILAENIKSSSLFMDITIIYSGTVSADSLCLCGTNVDDGVTVTVEGSNIDADTPEFTAAQVIADGFNALVLFDEVKTYKYWRVYFNNTESIPILGFIYHGNKVVYPNPVPSTKGPMSNSTSSLTSTRQQVGSKKSTFDSASYSFSYVPRSKIIELISFYRSVQNIIPVVVLPHEEDTLDALNHAMYVNIIDDSILNAQEDRQDMFSFSQAYEGVF